MSYEWRKRKKKEPTIYKKDKLLLNILKAKGKLNIRN